MAGTIDDIASIYDTVKGLYNAGTAPVAAGSGVGMDQPGLNKYNEAAKAMGEPTLTLEQWSALGKPLSP